MNRFYNKNVVVTGATGLIGSHLVKRLLEEEATVVALGRNKTKLRETFMAESDNNSLSCIEANITNGIPKDIGEVDYIFHAAGPISGRKIKSSPVDVIDANVKGTLNCLRFLKEQNKRQGRFIAFSSATVYGNQYDNDTTVSESDTYFADTLDSLNAAYSESKRMIEVMARAYSVQYNIDAVIARLAYVYGYTKFSPATAFYEFIHDALDGNDIVLNNSGLPKRDNIYVEDAVDGLMLIASCGVSGEAYNVSSNGDLDNYRAIDEIAQKIARTYNAYNREKNIRTIIPKQTTRNPGFKMSNAKIKELGWECKTSFEEGIDETVREYIESV